ncbi:zinc ribbon domain-containing protein [Haloarcula amylolytica]|uniref:zinc ribbon domain-containing protein n=1 Tax=Haloarcula amylolytica TaxID=396317 RepID=UPI003C794E3D
MSNPPKDTDYPNRKDPEQIIEENRDLLEKIAAADLPISQRCRDALEKYGSDDVELDVQPPAAGDEIQYCPQCGDGVDVGDQFCRHCGHELLGD